MIILVDEFTTSAPFRVSPAEPIGAVKQLLKEKGIRHLPVVDGNKLVGVISSRDVALAESLGHGTTLLAKDIMRVDPYIVTSGSTLEMAAVEMSSRKVGSAIVVDDDGVVVGIFTSTDALNALVDILRDDDSLRLYRSRKLADQSKRL